jgi:thioredoxin reductase (NADPH)
MGRVETYDCLIVGGGPAGLSAAIYVARYNRSAVVIDHWRGRWRSHEINENYLGFPNGVPAKRLRALGRRQAERFGVRFCRAKVTRLEHDENGFTAQAGRYAFRGRSVILATGVKDILPDIGRTDEFWGKTLFWCITCDGHKVQGAKVVIVGTDDHAAISTVQFKNFTDKLAFVTACPPEDCELTEDGRGRLERAGIPIYEGRIDHAEGTDGVMQSVLLEDGTRVETDFMFSQLGCEPRCELAVSLGVRLAANGYIETNEEQRTNVPFVYAAGDVTRAFAHQVVTASHEGATAGIAANYDLYEEWQRH